VNPALLTRREFAVLGGEPVFTEPLHVGAPNVCDTKRLFRRLEAALERRRLANHGPYVSELERRLAERLQVRHCLAVCNGTVGLGLAAHAVGLSGEVIVPAWTFVATAHALTWQGMTPVFCDVDPVTHNLDPARVEAAITPRTTGILAVHLWGRPAPVAALAAIASHHGLHLIYDAAHAFSATSGRVPIGNFGEAEVFSFHATKFFNTAEGGAITTNDDDLAGRLRLAMNFGFAGLDSVVALGINGKMNELSAAVGLTGLEDLDQVLAINAANHRAYARRFAELPGLTLLTYAENEASNHQYVVVEVDAAVAGLTRDQLVALLRAENCMVRRYFHPGCHRMAPYAQQARRLPVTEALAARTMVLPTGSTVSPDAIRRIGEILHDALARADELREVVT
jgi:dTDP-4-amino-4,6-dideoxygalactose transaminase